MRQVAFGEQELPFEINEAMRLLRTNLQFCGKDKKVILVTSALANEGKSTLALNLCRSLAQLDSNVILIDADMRKSIIAEQLKSEDKDLPGLSHLLSAHNNLGDVLFETDVNRFHIILAGRVPPNPAELLANARMEALIKFCREKYDYVIIDCPPISIVADAAIAAPMCDGILMVVSSGNVHYRLAQNALDQLKATNCPILGVVLNMVDRKNERYQYYGGGYYKKYGGYYGYGSYYGYGGYNTQKQTETSAEEKKPSLVGRLIKRK